MIDLKLEQPRTIDDKEMKKNEKTNTTWTTFKTNNPKLFWQIPR